MSLLRGASGVWRTQTLWNIHSKGWNRVACLPAAEQRCPELGEGVRGIRAGFVEELRERHTMNIWWTAWNWNGGCSINTSSLVDWLWEKPSEILRRKGLRSPSFLLHNYFSAFKAPHFSSYTLNIREKLIGQLYNILKWLWCFGILHGYKTLCIFNILSKICSKPMADFL